MKKIALFLALFPIVAYAETPTLSFSVNPQTIEEGEAVAISWATQNAGTCIMSGGWSSAIPPFGAVSLRPSATTNYGIACGGPYGAVSDIKTVFVNKKESTPLSSSIIVSTSLPASSLIPASYAPVPLNYVSPIPFTAACAASPTVTETGKIVTFAAAQNGGVAPFSYQWGGDIYGTNQVEQVIFSGAGIKTIRIRMVDSKNMVAEGSCSATINLLVPPILSRSGAPTTSIETAPKKPTVVVAQTTAPACKTVTVCIDTAGNVIQKNEGDGAPKAEPKIETAKNGNGKTFFLASLFGKGNGTNGNGSARNFAIYLLPIFAAAAVIFLGYMVVRFSKRA